MTPDVERQLYRAAASFVDVFAIAAHVVFYLAGAYGDWLRERSEILTARADVSDSELVAGLEEDAP